MSVEPVSATAGHGRTSLSVAYAIGAPVRQCRPATTTSKSYGRRDFRREKTRVPNILQTPSLGVTPE